MSEKKQGKFYYGWLIVVACFLLSAASTGLLTNLNALFITPAIETLQVSHSTFMLYSTLAMFAAMIFMPITGTLFRKHSARKLIIIGAIFGASAHILYSIATNVWFFYIGGILAGASSGLFGTVPMTLLLSNWFYEKRGTMTGIAFTGSSLSTSALSPIVTRLIEAYGWRMTYRFLAVSIIVLCIIVVLIVRMKPADMGLRPYGTAQKDEKDIEPVGFMRGQAVKMPFFWIFAFALFLLGLIVSGTQQQLVTYWTSEGISTTTAANYFSLVLLVGLVFKILLGGVFDHFGCAKSSLACGIIASAGLLSLAFCTKGFTVIIPTVLFGITTATMVMVPAFLANRLFGEKDFPSNSSLLTTVLFFGSAVGIPLSASFFDILGSYRSAWVLYGVIALVMMAALLISNQLSRKAFKNMLGLERRD